MNTKLFIWIGSAIVGITVIAFIAWTLFLKPTPSTSVTTSESLGTATQTTSMSPSASSGTSGTNQTTPLPQGATAQKVFKIADGPVSGATFIQTFLPTTTLARFVLQENGHVMDQPLDVPGSLPRAVSGTTIPGIQRVLWGKGGATALMQYQDGNVVKTLSFVIPPATSSKSTARPIEVQFLPDNITSLALAPSGTQVAYLLPEGSGSAGYVTNINSSNAKKLFSINFTQLLLSWPSSNTLLLSTKSASGVAGAVFSADSKTGALVPLIYGDGITAMADSSFSSVVYRVDTGSSPSSYLHNMKKGTDEALSFDPIPEKCTWGGVATSTLYCAAPARYAGAGYLDLWHQGFASLPDLIVSFMPAQNSSTRAIATPGSSDGGVESDILEMAVSPDDKYLLFVKKGDRSLWGVRLAQ